MGKKLVLYSGPSCVGKGPLRTRLETHYPQYAPGNVGRVVLYTSRPPRPGEQEGVHYKFRTADEIGDMIAREPQRYISGWIRGEQLQAIDLLDARQRFEEFDTVLMEIYHTLGAQVLEPQHLEALSSDVKPVTIFISPLSSAEISELKSRGADLRRAVTQLMKLKLDRRDAEPEEKRRARAEDAYSELKSAHKYTYVIANHDGEDSENWGFPTKQMPDWSLPYPIGDARKTLEAFANVLKCGNDWRTERWNEETI